MTRIRLQFVHEFRDRHGKVRRYLRRSGCKAVPLPGLPGSAEFMAAYQAALAGMTAPQKQIGAARTVAGTVQALVAAYLDCSPGSTSPLKALAAETQRTRRNILENLREAHGDKRIYRTEANGRRVMLLDREHVQRMVNEKNSTPFGQRNFLNTLRALFKWAVAEGRVPERSDARRHPAADQEHRLPHLVGERHRAIQTKARARDRGTRRHRAFAHNRCPSWGRGETRPTARPRRHHCVRAKKDQGRRGSARYHPATSARLSWQCRPPTLSACHPPRRS